MANNNTFNGEFFNKKQSGCFLENLIDREKALLHAKKHYKTGWPSINKATNGGFEEGLCVLFASPNIGKTTFLAQFAYETSLKTPVLFFSLEMDREDLIAKYISMETYLKNTADTSYAVKADNLRSAQFINNASKREWSYIQEAGEETKNHLKNIYILDASDGLLYTADNIAMAVEEFMKHSSTPPVVIVDYIQRIPATEKLQGSTEKIQIDHTLNVLGDLAHRNKILVFAISSITKTDFTNEKSDMGALAGSNRLGFDPDGIFKLKYHNTDNLDDERKKAERDIDFTVIKQRMCETGMVIPLKFLGAFSYFYEPGMKPESEEELDKDCPYTQQELLLNEC